MHASERIDPRGPSRTITAIDLNGGGWTLITKSCGHTSEYANHFTYKVGAPINCFDCRDADDNRKRAQQTYEQWDAHDRYVLGVLSLVGAEAL